MIFLMTNSNFFQPRFERARRIRCVPFVSPLPPTATISVIGIVRPLSASSTEGCAVKLFVFAITSSGSAFRIFHSLFHTDHEMQRWAAEPGGNATWTSCPPWRGAFSWNYWGWELSWHSHSLPAFCNPDG